MVIIMSNGNKYKVSAVKLPPEMQKIVDSMTQSKDQDGLPGIHTKSFEGHRAEINRDSDEFLNRMVAQYKTFRILNISESTLFNGACRSITYRI